MPPVAAFRAGEPLAAAPARRDLLARFGPLAIVLATLVANLWELRATTTAVAYLDDSSVQEQMVRAATALLRGGHDPLVSWYPYLQLGSPQFLHYQSSPAILTAVAGLVAGPDVAFRWSLYLLWALWPLAVYLSARVFGLRPWAAACAAAVAPLLSSVPGVGYEAKAYIWIGYGVWAQLWASWALPFAWAFTWRAVADRRFVAPAAAAVAATAALHYETGYLAFAPIVLFPFLVPGDLRRRLGRAVVVLAGAAAASAWVIVPLVVLGRWASINEALQGTPLVDGYGARQILAWLVDGRLFDNGHFPVVTLLAAAGAVACAIAWRRDPTGRALVILLCLGLVLSFGRTTFGSLANLLPGGSDVFYRRFAMAADLAAIYLAGAGSAALASTARRLLTRLSEHPSLPRALRRRVVPVVLVVLGGCGALFPAWRAAGDYDNANANAIAAQVSLQTVAGTEIAPLIAYVLDHGGGRVYAGMPSNWGHDFTVGYVPVYEYLASEDVDAVGFTLRTASLMTGPEYDFDEANAGDYELFGIRYLLLPAGRREPVRMHLVLSGGPYRLYVIAGDGYVRAVDTVGTLTATRRDVGAATQAYLEGPLPAAGRYMTMAYAGAAAAPPTLAPSERETGAAGTVLRSQVDLVAGQASATVRMARRGVVVLAASFDPGWRVTVDGRAATAEMVAPALVGVAVGAGTHTVTFRYVGFRWYGELFALALAALVVLVIATVPALDLRRLGRRRSRRAPAA